MRDILQESGALNPSNNAQNAENAAASAVSSASSSIPTEQTVLSMPSVFPKNTLDAEYFSPKTDDYKLVLFEFPEVCAHKNAWHQDSYGTVYYSVDEFIALPMSVVYMECYDETGRIYLYPGEDQNLIQAVYAKSVYRSLEDFVAIYGEPVFPYKITEKNEKDESLIELDKRYEQILAEQSIARFRGPNGEKAYTAIDEVTTYYSEDHANGVDYAFPDLLNMGGLGHT